jgi:TonB-linked SusC/RagA family outer membrane protein
LYFLYYLCDSIFLMTVFTVRKPAQYLQPKSPEPGNLILKPENLAPGFEFPDFRVWLLFFIFFLSAYMYPARAQDARVRMPKSSVRVSELLDQIESQTEYLFVYNKKKVDVGRTVNTGTESKRVSELLDEAFRGTGTGYVMVENHIVLTQNAEPPARENKITVRGRVTDTKGEPVAGANVTERGSGATGRGANAGTTTDGDGGFGLETGGNASLVVSYMGYKAQTVAVGGRTWLAVRLEEEVLPLETVVVTAMGIMKKEASLAYSTQLIGSDELVRARDANLMNALSGKMAGVRINRNSSGLGGSVRVNIRGSRSINGNNQPLYVIDGAPMLNSATEQVSTILGGVADSGNRDGGDGISNLNPDDIESLHVLKGASAAALYGSQAANGVVLITTRKGRAGFRRASFSSHVAFDRPVSLPEFQNSYGMDGNRTSWGGKAALTDHRNTDGFFRGGVTAVHTVTLSTGNGAVQTYFSYGNTYGKGIVEGHSLNRHNLNFRQTASFLNERLTLDGNLNLMQQTLKNRPVTGGYYLNPLVGLYGFPRGEELEGYRADFEVYDPERKMNVQNWHTRISGLEQNPYWLTRRVLNNDRRYRAIAGLSAKLKIDDRLTVQARGTADHTGDKYSQRMYASTASDITGTYYPDGSEVGYRNGRYANLDRSESLFYGDLMALFNYAWGHWAVSGAIGASVNHTGVNSLYLDSRAASLYYPNVFTVANIVMTADAYIEESIDERREIQSLFATAQLGWKERVYLDVTARNDWSSTLAFTRSKSYFYPSAGLSWIVSNGLRLPAWISFGKVRGSWSQVGNDLPLFYSRLGDHIVAGGAIQGNDRAPFDALKPELSVSVELGTEWKFFDRRLDLDLTFYRTNTRNQLLTLPSSAGAEYKFYMVNAGNIENKGIEVTLGATPVMNAYFRWKTGISYSANRNRIVALHPKLNSFVYGDEGFSMSYAMRLKEGGAFGDIYGWKFDRDEDGVIRLNEKGLPLTIGSGNTEKVGNSNPDYMLGWSNMLSCKGFSLYFLIDARVGGDVLSQTQAELDYRGVSANTAKARERGYVDVGGQRFTDVEAFYKHIGARTSTVTEYYMYNATNVRLRELSLGYSFPRIDLSLVGRNLFFFRKDAPFDPDAVMSTGNSCQGADVFGMPTTRSVGFNIKFTF